ncbi:hypothetical protein B0T26DRAFT_731201 [Lasiosphaeria miniovina]|uniref:Subtilisin-like serine protease n=1 Tax=Lasiosphaeria miniovina TaxID=1954250 RepID=A0AA39ZTP9_9PEZI|nr:uncharacterized protein B0T26DRAFT_731201 [Lasiosphaeria miniovina]KAK0703407.1 hypothetical protein B0T26DRAFT_731201 [Lasiosphaeria miniovina]
MSTLIHSQIPFPPSCAPNTDRLSPYDGVSIQNGSSEPENAAGSITHVPGDPSISLLPDNVYNYLSHHLETVLLDELYEKLWIVAKKSSRNIDPLHTQKVKGRSIVPTEDPRLHLTWHPDRIYIKPIPVFLLNYEFWTTYLQPSTQNSSSGFDSSIAVGFLRSYALLVPHRLDFMLAKEAYLIPDDVSDWLQWSKFITHFRHLSDESVARRYHYGQLRISRLNWAVRIFRPRHARTMWFYEIPHWSITSFVSRATIPLLFIFAGISLVLSSMQVALSVPTDDPWFDGLSESGLQDIGRGFWVFSIAIILGWVALWALFLSIPIVTLVWQVSWGFAREKKRRARVFAA